MNILLIKKEQKKRLNLEFKKTVNNNSTMNSFDNCVYRQIQIQFELNTNNNTHQDEMICIPFIKLDHDDVGETIK